MFLYAKKFSAKIIFVFSFASLLFFSHTVFAAELDLYPSSGSYSVGDTIEVVIVLSSPDQPANVVSGNLKFSKDLLTLTSISKADSLVSFWQVNPSYSNTDGTIDIGGGAILSGYTGSNGSIATLYFKAKATGSANLTFTKSSVLADDGQGTEISQSSGKASFQINNAGVSSLSNTNKSASKNSAATSPAEKNVITLNNISEALNNSFGASSGFVGKINNLNQQSPLLSVNRFLIIIYIIVFIILLILFFIFFIYRRNRENLSKLVKSFEKDIQSLQFFDISKEKELLKIKENMELKLNERADSFEKTIEQIKADNSAKEKELLAIKENMELKLNERADSFEKTIEQIKADNSSKGELLQSLSRMQTDTDSKIILFKNNIEELKIADTTKGSDISEMKEELENQLQTITNLFKKDIQQLQETATANEKELLHLRENDALNEEELQKIKGDLYLKLEEELKSLATLSENHIQNSAKKQELALLKVSVEKKVEERLKDLSLSFGLDIEQIRKINAVKEIELAKLKERLSNMAELLKKMPSHSDIRDSSSAMEKGLSVTREEMFSNLKEKLKEVSTLFSSDIQQMKKISVAKEIELAKLKNRLGDMVVLLNKVSQQPKPDISKNKKEKELLKIKEEIQAKLEEKIILLKKDLKTPEKREDLGKELSKLEVKLEKKIKDGLKSDVALLGKEINKFKNADSDKQKRLSSLEKRIEEKTEGNTEEKINDILKNLDSKLKGNTMLLEGKLSELKKTGIAGKEKISKLEDSIKKINEYNQKLDLEEQELKKQIMRINNSLRAFYSNAMLSTDKSPRGRK